VTWPLLAPFAYPERAIFIILIQTRCNRYVNRLFVELLRASFYGMAAKIVTGVVQTLSRRDPRGTYYTYLLFSYYKSVKTRAVFFGIFRWLRNHDCIDTECYLLLLQQRHLTILFVANQVRTPSMSIQEDRYW